MNNLPIITIFAILPSIIWLWLYLRQDKKPEPKIMIVKVFILGMIAALFAIILEKGAASLYASLKDYSPRLIFILYIFIGIAFVEELLKYLVIKFSVLKNPEMDEPLDILIYMITGALGFAALENLFLFLSPSPFLIAPSFQEILFMSVLRMLTATIFHALCSGILGYFIALSFYRVARKSSLTISGIVFVTLLHGLYNFSIMDVEGVLLKYGIMIILLVSMTSLLSAFILKIKKLPSICK